MMTIPGSSRHISRGVRSQESGVRSQESGVRKKEEGRRKKEEGRRKKEEGSKKSLKVGKAMHLIHLSKLKTLNLLKFSVYPAVSRL
ncbi:hypothetical protein [Anabaena sp. AL09]|jgi:hypothetical protein|uniref:hypothetical protein n=1 Tax=Anabaena sp. AL09 TaxID=1710891 RepID=UPI00263969D9|nr:hypothetical protein [Anabaena sp. AL09]